MGKFASRKDSFFIAKKQKTNTEASTSNKNFVKKERYSVNKQTANTDSGSFFIKPAEKPQPVKTQQRTEKTKSDNLKKPFDKKKWRLQKYSKKYKLEQWEERRKKNLLQEYYKQIENEPTFDVQRVYEKYADDTEDNENENNLNNDTSESGSKNETTAQATTSSSKQETLPKSIAKPKFKKNAQEEFKRKQEDKKQRKAEIEKKKAEKAEKMKAYKEKKFERYKKLNKKNKKGQPIMKYRMEMLLEQIQKSVQ